MCVGGWGLRGGGGWRRVIEYTFVIGVVAFLLFISVQLSLYFRSGLICVNLQMHQAVLN